MTGVWNRPSIRQNSVRLRILARNPLQVTPLAIYWAFKLCSVLESCAKCIPSISYLMSTTSQGRHFSPKLWMRHLRVCHILPQVTQLGSSLQRLNLRSNFATHHSKTASSCWCCRPLCTPPWISLPSSKKLDSCQHSRFLNKILIASCPCVTFPRFPSSIPQTQNRIVVFNQSMGID